MWSLVARAAALVVVGSALGLLVNAVRPAGVALRAAAPPVACVAPPAPPRIEVLAPAQALTLCDDRGVLIADARPAARFAKGHVAGALHLPCAASGEAARGAVGLTSDKHTVIVYGDTTAEARPVADELGRRAGRAGLRVVVLEGGFP